MKHLLHLPSARLVKLYHQAYARMAEGDDRQPFGYDWRTVRLTKPGWYRALRTIIAAAKWKERQELRAARRKEDQAWAAAEVVASLRHYGLV